VRRNRELGAFGCDEALGGVGTFCSSVDCPVIEDAWDVEECIHEDEGPVVNDAKVEVEPKDFTRRKGRLRR
jgi:hypothetical protein